MREKKGRSIVILTAKNQLVRLLYAMNLLANVRPISKTCSLAGLAKKECGKWGAFDERTRVGETEEKKGGKRFRLYVIVKWVNCARNSSAVQRRCSQVLRMAFWIVAPSILVCVFSLRIFLTTTTIFCVHWLMLQPHLFPLHLGAASIK